MTRQLSIHVLRKGTEFAAMEYSAILSQIALAIAEERPYYTGEDQRRSSYATSADVAALCRNLNLQYDTADCCLLTTGASLIRLYRDGHIVAHVVRVDFSASGYLVFGLAQTATYDGYRVTAPAQFDCTQRELPIPHSEGTLAESVERHKLALELVGVLLATTENLFADVPVEERSNLLIEALARFIHERYNLDMLGVYCLFDALQRRALLLLPEIAQDRDADDTTPSTCH